MCASIVLAFRQARHVLQSCKTEDEPLRLFYGETFRGTLYDTINVEVQVLTSLWLQLKQYCVLSPKERKFRQARHTATNMTAAPGSRRLPPVLLIVAGIETKKKKKKKSLSGMLRVGKPSSLMAFAK
jgi:hypothetical protein